MISRARPVEEKPSLRARARRRRRDRTPAEREQAGAAIAAALLDVPEVAAAGTVTAYVSVGTEPPTTALLESLVRRGVRVLLPVVLPDLDLAWAVYEGPDSLVDGPHGLREPAGPRLGREAVREADAVLCPGLLVDSTGTRLGQGGGCYDRALGRIGPQAWSCVLLYADEVLDEALPAEPHDRRVRAAVTPAGLVRFPG